MRLFKNAFMICLFALSFTVSGRANADLIACDPSVLEENKVIVDALNQLNAEIAKSTITQPTSIGVMTCEDQQSELLNASGNLHANSKGDISASLGPFVQQPIIQDMNNFLQGVSAQVNAISNSLTSSFNSLFEGFDGGLTSLTGGSVPSTNCNMTEQTWLMSQCLEMPSISSLGDILNGKIYELSGLLGDLVDPQRYIEQVCSAANSKLHGYFSDLNSSLDSAAEKLMTPIDDFADTID